MPQAQLLVAPAAECAALGIASNRYRAGYSSYIEQLDAQRGLLTAELTLIQARADRLTAYVTLYQALGGGWSRAGVADHALKEKEPLCPSWPIAGSANRRPGTR